MPGSCDSDQSNSSSSLISSLRKYRFQNKSKQPQATENSTPSSSKTGTSSNSPSRPLLSQKSSTSAYNPLSYRKYDSSSESQLLLQNISAKIQTLFKNTSISIPFLDLKLTIGENDQFKDIVLQNSSLSIKWSSCVSETSSLAPNEKLYKVKRTYLHELSKHICNVLNSKLAKNSSVQFTADNPPVRTYSRPKTVKSPANQNTLSNSVPPSDNQNNGAMDDYEEFCEKEQSLRKMLDAFPGADIMEAQDILVKCQWNLNKAIQEAKSLPLRTISRKRGYQGPFMVQSPPAGNIPNQTTMSNSQPMHSSPNKVPEEIVIDSSDDEDINGNAANISSHPHRSAVACTRPSSAALPPAKRARRPISTSSSEDEAASSGSKSPISPAFQRPPTQQNLQMSIAPVQKQSGSVLQASRSAPMSKPTSTPPVDIRLPSNQNSPIEKTINVPQTLSIKPVPVSTPSNNEHTSSSSNMPNLPKGLVITQLGGANKSNNKDHEDVEASLNGNHPNNIPSNSNKSAQLVRIKPSNSVTVTSSSTPISKNADMSFTPVNKNVSITPVSKNISVTPVCKSVSVIPVTQAVSIASAPKNLSITPVGGNSEVHTEKSSFSSSEEEPAGDKLINSKKGRRRIKNIESLMELKEPENSEETNANESASAKKAKSPEKKKGRPKGSTKQASPKQVNSNKVAAKHTKRRKFSSDEDEDEDYGNEDIYDSEDSDCGENLTPAHSAVLKFFQEATTDELASVPGCSKRKIEVLQNLRPFSKWMDLVEKLRNDKTLSTDLLNGVKKVLDMRNAINKLMNKCQRISLDMEDLVEDLKENKESSSGYVSKQPELLNERMHLTAYQMLGLNWLLLMHNQQVNAILADEMGLGKTVQAVSFLAYLKQISESGPHLIVVPSSTLDNWKKELETWWPTVSIICYHGQQESRRDLRMQILNDEVEEFDVMITTYNMVTSSAEDRSFFKRLEFNYVVFDEAHMLKNMSSQRYTNLMRIKAPRRLLLTGTPLQNNLVELMSLLIFAMPNMFSGKTEQIKQMFTCVSKADGSKNSYEKDRIDHAKRIMKPFVLRRLKKDVLKELPAKVEETKLCPMAEDQAEKYKDLVKKFSDEVQTESKEDKDVSNSGAGMMMQLRRGANHPLLLRRFYDDDKLLVMAKKMLKEPTHSQSDPNMIFEDMAVMSDFELHKLCKQYKSIKSYALPDATILNSGKFKVLDELLPDLIHEDHRILLFSQFTMVLDIVQDYMNIKEYKFLRLDGQTPVSDRQQLIDEFNNDPEILVFLLSTRAGGLGINLTAADTVILHDIDFNPYNDKQAEDRCHRVGQVRDVRVIRLISENTIEEGILQRAKEKLKLERDIHEEETEESDTASVAMLLRDALGLNTKKS